MPGKKHWAQCQFSSGFSCVSLSVEFLPVHIQRRLWSSVMVNWSPIPTTILWIWSHMFWERKKIIWVRGSPFNNEKTHWTTQFLKSGSQTSLQGMWVQQGQHKNIQSHGTCGKILEHICSSLSAEMAVWAHCQRFVAFLTRPGWVKVASRCAAVTASEHSANTPQGSLEMPLIKWAGFFHISPLYCLSWFFFSVLCMLLQMFCCSLYLLLLRHWQNSNLSRGVSTFQCNKK